MPVLAGSTIGAMAPFATTWLTQHYQGLTQRLNQAASRREQLIGEFIGHASETYIDAVVQEILDDPTKLVSLYAVLNKLRLFATPNTTGAAEVVLRGIVKTYDAPRAVLLERNSESAARDILREFAVSCRAELTQLR
jgi:hypothetical protein